MNSLKIELSSILSVKYAISLHGLMQDYIGSNDKEPSWDGSIYLYNSNDLKVENLKYRVPVQVKGKNTEKLLNKNAISYKVQYKHLRNYYQDGGIFYIVVVISDDGKRTSIFYNSLTTIKLAEILKGKEGKNPEQEKNIPLLRLEKNDSKKLYEVLSQFGLERQKQGSGNGEIIKNAINISDMNNIDYVQASSFTAKSEIDILKEISTGEVSLYGHRRDLDILLPFDFSEQMKLKIVNSLPINNSVSVDNETFYDSYLVEYTMPNEDKPSISLSENLTLDIFNGKLHFNVKGDIASLNRDAKFVTAMIQGKNLYVNGQNLIDLSSVKIPKKFKEELNEILDLNKAFEEIKFVCTKKVSDYSEENWKYVNQLLKLYRREIKPKMDNSNAWYMWSWDDKVIPLFLHYNLDNELDVVNWFYSIKYTLHVEKEKSYRVPKFALIKRDVYENLIEVDKNIWFEEIECVEFTEHIKDEINNSLVELIAAYDITQNQIYFDVANTLADKILKVLPEDEYSIINKMQISKRRRKLSEEEIIRLEELEKNSINPMTKCAINILLENKRLAERLLKELTENEQKEMKSFPIYNLLV